MTDEEINKAIAEACGFVCLREFQVDKDGAKFGFWEYPPTWTGPKKQPWCLDFCNDLNAMHEAEQALNTDELFEQYYLTLYETTRSTRWPVRAKARQRAEAFLRTLGKWK
jgi:hypothetical protein